MKQRHKTSRYPIDLGVGRTRLPEVIDLERHVSLVISEDFAVRDYDAKKITTGAV